MNSTTATVTAATVGAVEVAVHTYEAEGRFILHIYENGKHTGTTYAAATAEERDSLIDIILGR